MTRQMNFWSSLPKELANCSGKHYIQLLAGLVRAEIFSTRRLDRAVSVAVSLKLGLLIFFAILVLYILKKCCNLIIYLQTFKLTVYITLIQYKIKNIILYFFFSKHLLYTCFSKLHNILLYIWYLFLIVWITDIVCLCYVLY